MTLVRYFKRVYRGIDNIKILGEGLPDDSDITIPSIKDSPLPELTLVNMTGKVYNHLIIEREEQDIANKYIDEDAVVLELGARFGSVSCTINKRLKTKANQVSVEPDQRVWENLKENKLKNNCGFHILEGAISKRNLSLNFSGYATRSLNNGEGTVKTFTLEEVQANYNLRFDTLVADCEGFLEQFFDENPTFYEQLKLVTYEKDFPDKCNYEKIADRLVHFGFKKIVSGFHEVWQK
jgi:FkbM family methyltransferase